MEEKFYPNNNRINGFALTGFIISLVLAVFNVFYLIYNLVQVSSSDNDIIILAMNLLFLLSPIAISSLIGSVASFIFSIIGLKEIKKNNERGKGLAIFGLLISAIIGVISFIIIILFFIMLITFVASITTI